MLWGGDGRGGYPLANGKGYANVPPPNGTAGYVRAVSCRELEPPWKRSHGDVTIYRSGIAGLSDQSGRWMRH